MQKRFPTESPTLRRSAGKNIPRVCHFVHRLLNILPRKSPAGNSPRLHDNPGLRVLNRGAAWHIFLTTEQKGVVMRSMIRTLFLAVAVLFASAAFAQEGRQHDSLRHEKDSVGKGPDSIGLPPKKMPNEATYRKKKNTADTAGRKKMPPRRRK
jgi:hypothetical protein